MMNTLKVDPSRTTTLRRKCVREMHRRFAAVASAVRQLIVDEDVFGLNPRTDPLSQLNSITDNAPAFRFTTDANKVKEFRKWLQQQIDANILSVEGGPAGKPWLAEYVNSAYRKGIVHSYAQTHKESLAGTEDFYLGGKEQFLRTAFASPETVRKIELLYERAFSELKGVTAAMDQQLSRHLEIGRAHV